jgi:bacillithiol biosynthesis deacetylase BshB1
MNFFPKSPLFLKSPIFTLSGTTRGVKPHVAGCMKCTGRDPVHFMHPTKVGNNLSAASSQPAIEGSTMALDYLVIAAHPDDAELCLGGTILALKAQGDSVGILDLTDGEPTPHGSPEIRRRETEAATALLGVDWRGNLGLTNRALVADLEARARLAGQIRQLQPQVLFAHYWEDAHPDHVVASALVDAARFWAKLSKTDLPGQSHFPRQILYFFSFHLRQHVQPSLVLDVSDYHDAKMQVLNCYHSQFIEGRPTTPPTFFDEVRDRDRYWGWAIGTRYGEPLLCRELVGLRSLAGLSGMPGKGHGIG